MALTSDLLNPKSYTIWQLKFINGDCKFCVFDLSYINTHTHVRIYIEGQTDRQTTGRILTLFPQSTVQSG